MRQVKKQFDRELSAYCIWSAKYPEYCLLNYSLYKTYYFACKLEDMIACWKLQFYFFRIGLQTSDHLCGFLWTCSKRSILFWWKKQVLGLNESYFTLKETHYTLPLSLFIFLTFDYCAKMNQYHAKQSTIQHKTTPNRINQWHCSHGKKAKVIYLIRDLKFTFNFVLMVWWLMRLLLVSKSVIKENFPHFISKLLLS